MPTANFSFELQRWDEKVRGNKEAAEQGVHTLFLGRFTCERFFVSLHITAHSSFCSFELLRLCVPFGGLFDRLYMQHDRVFAHYLGACCMHGSGKCMHARCMDLWSVFFTPPIARISRSGRREALGRKNEWLNEKRKFKASSEINWDLF